MFHVEHGTEAFEAIEDWLGIAIDSGQREKFARLESWLRDEAIPAGGIGRAEHARLFDRHIMDSLAFDVGIPDDARTAVDVGGGVGLPSIPLAILRPDIDFVLVDRSRRRTDLAGRAGRILGLRNHTIINGEISQVDTAYDVALFRASLPISAAATILSRCLDRSGVGLLGVSRQSAEPDIPSAPEGITFALSREGDRVLTSPFWLLTMRNENKE